MISRLPSPQSNIPTDQHSLLTQIHDFNNNISSLIGFFKKVGYYIGNPLMLLKAIILGLAGASYYVCILIVIWCIIFYIISESKKAKQTGYVAFGIFAMLQLLAYCFSLI
jgi:hypothetical protein